MLAALFSGKCGCKKRALNTKQLQLVFIYSNWRLAARPCKIHRLELHEKKRIQLFKVQGESFYKKKSLRTSLECWIFVSGAKQGEFQTVQPFYFWRNKKKNSVKSAAWIFLIYLLKRDIVKRLDFFKGHQCLIKTNNTVMGWYLCAVLNAAVV